MAGKVPEPTDRFTVVTSQLLHLVEIAMELETHDSPENKQYWIGARDMICILLGDLSGMKPVIVNPDAYLKIRDMQMENEIQEMFPEDPDPYYGFDC